MSVHAPKPPLVGPKADAAQAALDAAAAYTSAVCAAAGGSGSAAALAKGWRARSQADASAAAVAKRALAACTDRACAPAFNGASHKSLQLQAEAYKPCSLHAMLRWQAGMSWSLQSQ